MNKLKVVAEDSCCPFIHPASYSQAASNLVGTIIGAESEMLFKNMGLSCQWCVDPTSFKIAGEATLKKLADKKFFEIVKMQSVDTIKKLLCYAKQINETNLLPLSNAELGEQYAKLFNLWVDVNLWGHVVNLSDFEHFMLTNKIMGFLEGKATAKTTAAEAFSILLTPNKRSVLQQQDLDFFALLVVYKADSAALEKHTLKYRWMQFHYDGPTILDSNYFEQILDGFSKDGVDGNRKIAEILHQEREVINKQIQLVAALHLSQEEVYWLEVGKELAFLKALRKDGVFEACCDSFPLVKEIAKRLQLSTTQVKFMTIGEVKRSLETKKVDLQEVNSRLKHCIVTGKGGVVFHTGKEADKIASNIFEETVSGNTTELKGTPAFPGRVTGSAKLLLVAADMEKFQQGDVLVSAATNPNLLPAMKIAGAIVTDEGGITCHAAIVSRELKIPCVIGTKVATKWLKDGDKVEVDAVKGIVRKL